MWKASPKHEDDAELEEHQEFLSSLDGAHTYRKHEQQHVSQRRRPFNDAKLQCYVVLPSILLAIVFSGLLIWNIRLQIAYNTHLSISKRPTTSHSPNEHDVQSPYIVGNCLTSEFPSLCAEVTYSPQNYTSTLSYDPAQKRVVMTSSESISYFGSPLSEPSPDLAWKELLKHQYPYLYDEEIEPWHGVQSSDHFFGPNHHVRFEPDVFHSLHCLNAIRRRVNLVLYPDVPPSKEYMESMRWHEHHAGKEWTNLHIEHCMDRIRQSLMCHPDLTPGPLHISPGFPIALGTTGERICRDWAPIKQWLERRWMREQSEQNTK